MGRKRHSAEEIVNKLGQADVEIAKGSTAAAAHRRRARTDRTGRERTTHVMKDWMRKFGMKKSHFEPGSPWENGYLESSSGTLRGELLDREIFYMLRETKVLIERWRRHYNQVRPHSSLGYRPRTPEAVAPARRRSLPSGAPLRTPRQRLHTASGLTWILGRTVGQARSQRQ